MHDSVKCDSTDLRQQRYIPSFKINCLHVSNNLIHFKRFERKNSSFLEKEKSQHKTNAWCVGAIPGITLE